MADGFGGDVLRREDPGYEAARRDCVWNARIADRFPDLIVQAADEQDVVRAIRLARDQEMKVGVRSGGHSWAGSHLRDGGMLLDLSRLTGLSLDAEARVAVVQPGLRGSELASTLRAPGSSSPSATARAWPSAGTCFRAGSDGSRGFSGRPART